MLDLISQNLEIILLVVISIFLIWNLLLELRLNREKKRTTNFFQGTQAKDLEEVIVQILKRQKISGENIKKAIKRIKSLEEIALISLQKVGTIRFNPFERVGGNQSFSIAMLDQQDNGFVLSSYHSKENTRIYAKPIKQGRSQFPLTKEEERAIKKAIS